MVDPSPDTQPTSHSDADLLRAFTADNDADAFATLVSRYAGMVNGVCRRSLPLREDAEDAFQATWLIVAMQAGSLKNTNMFPGWLFRVAQRTARRMATGKTGSSSGQSAENALSEVLPDTAGTSREVLDQLARDETLHILDAELSRLPRRYRSVLVLCYLEDYTRDEAAEFLGCTLAAVKAALQRGRALLRQRLARRGVSLSVATVLIWEFVKHSTAASAAVIEQAARTGWFWQTGHAMDAAPTIVSLAHEGSQPMVKTSLGKLCVTAGLACALTITVCIWLWQPVTAQVRNSGPSGNNGVQTVYQQKEKPAGAPVVVRMPINAQEAETLGIDFHAAPEGDARKVPLLGTWKRSMGLISSELTITDAEIAGKVTINEGGVPITLTFRAEYAVARGDLVYGVIQSADATTTAQNEDVTELGVYGTLLIEQPISFRYYRDEQGLTIKDINLGLFEALAAMDGDGDETMGIKMLIIGRYASE